MTLGYADYAALGELNGPKEWATVTPSDSVNFTRVPRGIGVLTAGNVVLVDGAGNTMTVAFAANEWRACQPVRVNSTNTTAGTIKAFY